MFGVIHNVSAAETATDDLPSLELLEYLGSLVEENGDLIGPEDFDDEEDRVDDIILLGDDDEIPEEWRD